MNNTWNKHYYSLYFLFPSNFPFALILRIFLILQIIIIVFIYINYTYKGWKLGTTILHNHNLLVSNNYNWNYFE